MIHPVLMTIALLWLSTSQGAAPQVWYFPNILYGHILTGSGSSRYETVFTAVSQKETRARLALFTDRGGPMRASFVDEKGERASAGDSFEFFLSPERPVKIKLQLSPEEILEDVAVKTGWATFRAAGDIEVSALVRVTALDGKVLNAFLLNAEQPSELD
jgi:hypothetical protein